MVRLGDGNEISYSISQNPRVTRVPAHDGKSWVTAHIYLSGLGGPVSDKGS